MFTFTTHEPTVRFLAVDGTVSREAKRSIRKHAATGAFCVAKGDRLLPIEAAEGDVVFVRLAAEPVARLAPTEKVQAIAPVCTKEQLGIAKAQVAAKPVPVTKPKAAKAPKAQPAAAPAPAAPASDRLDRIEASIEALARTTGEQIAALAGAIAKLAAK